MRPINAADAASGDRAGGPDDPSSRPADAGAGQRTSGLLDPPPPLDADLVAAVAADVQRVFGAAGPAGEVVTVDGSGVRLSVRDGHLVVEDGLGAARRVRRFPRIAAGGTGRLSRIVVDADSGSVTLDALAWCRAAEVSVVGIDRDGQPSWSSIEPGPSDARLTRTLALAGSEDRDPLGVALVVGLLRAKLAGEWDLAGSVLGRADLADTIGELLAGLEVVESIEEARQLEAAAAACYWTAWAEPGPGVVTVPRFAPPSQAAKLPAAWGRFPARRSLLGAGASNRRATHPTNAMLNYCHVLARVEAARALRCLGLDPSLGLLHADTARRDSLACDLQETIRPSVERYLLDLLAARTFKRADFLEQPSGEVRLGPGLRAELAVTGPRWATEVAPWAETLRRALSRHVAGNGTSRAVTLGQSPLSGAARKAAAAEVGARRAARRDGQQRAQAAQRAAMGTVRSATGPETPTGGNQSGLWTCPDCAGPVGDPRRVRCESCIAADRRQTPQLRASRAQAISGRRQAEAGWSAHHPAGPVDPRWWHQVCRPALAGETLAAIRAATGVAKSTASGWRNGTRVPHPMHWDALATLAGVAGPDSSAQDGAGPVETYR